MEQFMGEVWEKNKQTHEQHGKKTWTIPLTAEVKSPRQGVLPPPPAPATAKQQRRRDQGGAQQSQQPGSVGKAFPGWKRHVGCYPCIFHEYHPVVKHSY